NMKDAGNFNFHSREVDEADNRPRLLLTVNGKPHTLEAVADTFLDRSTYRGQGNNKFLRVSGNLPALIRFDLSGLKKAYTIENAILQLVTFKQFANGEVGAFACDQGEEVDASAPILGLAAKHPGDRGIAKHPDVIFATDFESPDWQKEWTQAAGKVDTV